MRLVTLGALGLLLQAPFSPPRAQPADSRASIEGAVIRAGTGEPLPRAQVTLIRATAGIAPAAAAAAVAGGTAAALPAAFTDGDGKFTLNNVEPGSYRIAVARNGYARQEYGQRVFGGQGRVVTLVAGQAIRAIAVNLMPAGVVSGVVRDSLGEPMSGFQVQLLRAVYGPSGQRTFQTAGGDRTDDRGEYRVFWVTPGRYYVAVNSASPARAFAILGGAGSPNEVVERTYPATYYPGTIDVSQASVIEVDPGVEINSIDVTLAQQNLFHVRGWIVDPITGQPPRAASVSIVPRGPGAAPVGFSGSAPPYNPADGTFDLRDLAPGAYWIRATVTGNSAQSVVPASATGRTLVDFFSDSIFSERRAAQGAVDVFGSDVDGLVLMLSSGVSIRGRLSVEDQPLAAVADFERLEVTLRAATTGMLMNPTRHQPMSPDGEFTLENVLPGDYLTAVQSLPPEYYVKEARIADFDGLDRPMVITGPASGSLNIVLSRKAGQITGVVVDDRRQAVAGIQTVLVPDRRRGRIDLYKTAATDDTGRFSLQGIPPGDYKVFAWEAIEAFGYFDEDFLSQFELEGQRVRIEESSRERVEVKVIPAALP